MTLTSTQAAYLAITVTGLADASEQERAHARYAAKAEIATVTQADAEAMIRAFNHEGEETDTPALAALRNRWIDLTDAASQAAHAAGTKGWAHPERVHVQVEVSL